MTMRMVLAIITASGLLALFVSANVWHRHRRAQMSRRQKERDGREERVEAAIW